jgi:hypothetical protein
MNSEDSATHRAPPSPKIRAHIGNCSHRRPTLTHHAHLLRPIFSSNVATSHLGADVSMSKGGTARSQRSNHTALNCQIGRHVVMILGISNTNSYSQTDPIVEGPTAKGDALKGVLDKLESLSDAKGTEDPNYQAVKKEFESTDRRRIPWIGCNRC